jgi:hypothetical protein
MNTSLLENIFNIVIGVFINVILVTNFNVRFISKVSCQTNIIILTKTFRVSNPIINNIIKLTKVESKT